MVTFLFQTLIAVLLCGLFFYLIRWAATQLFPEIAQPIIVIVGILLLIAFLYFVWMNMPMSLGHPALRR